MRNRKVTFVEIVSDPEFKAREEEVSKAVNDLYPACGPVKLYRTADGQVGLELRVAHRRRVPGSEAPRRKTAALS